MAAGRRCAQLWVEDVADAGHGWPAGDQKDNLGSLSEAVRVVILTTFDIDEYIFEALEAGASGFLLKDADPEEIVRAVRAAASGDAVLSPSVTRRLITDYSRRPRRLVVDDGTLGELTDREREVMVLVARGLSNAEIAERLYLSPLTAKTHVSRILTKLGARDRVQLVIPAYRTGFGGARRPVVAASSTHPITP